MCLNDATRKKDVGSLNVLLRLRRSSKKLAKGVVAMVENGMKVAADSANALAANSSYKKSVRSLEWGPTILNSSQFDYHEKGKQVL